MKLWYEIGLDRREVNFTQEDLDTLRDIVQDWSDRLVEWENGGLEDKDFDIEELIYTLKDKLHIGGRYESMRKGDTLNQTYMDMYWLHRGK